MNKKEILIVDDDKEGAVELSVCIMDNFNSLGAAHYVTNKEAARDVFEKYPDIAIVLMDYDLKDGGNTILLTQEFLATRKVRIIAISNNEQGRKELVEAGCADQCPKEDVLDLLSKLEKILDKQEAAYEKSSGY